MKWLQLALRIVVGGVLLFAGALKLADPAAFAVEVANYHLMPQIAPYLAVVLPPLEIWIGLATLVAPRRWAQAGALVALVLFVIFTVAIAFVLQQGIDVSCGCFGGHSGPVTWMTLMRDVGLIAAAALLYQLAGREA